MVEKIMAVTAIVIFYAHDQWRLYYTIIETMFCADNIKNAILPIHYSRQVCQ